MLDKLKNEIFIDLGCGGYNCNVAAVAYLANAKAYMGIDVHADLSPYGNDKIQAFLREQYGLSDEVKSHTTLVRSACDLFENFLERVPDRAWYNFAINGLELYDSTYKIQEHLQRIMVPGNLVLANEEGNIDVKKLLAWPHYDTRIIATFTDIVHVYQKFDENDTTTQRHFNVHLKS